MTILLLAFALPLHAAEPLEAISREISIYLPEQQTNMVEAISREVSLLLPPEPQTNIVEAISREISLLLPPEPTTNIAEAISRELSVFLPAVEDFFGREAISRELSVLLPEPTTNITDAISREFSIFLPDPIPAPAGLIAWWPGNNSAQDIVGTNHGTLRNGAGFSAGLVRESFRLDGVNDDLPLSYPVGGGPEMTVAAWIFVERDTGEAQAIFSAATNEFCHLQVGSSGNVLLHTDTGNILLPVVPLTVTGAWHHVALTVRFGESSLYVDGAVLGTSSDTFNHILTSSDVRIGSGYQGSRFFAGQIDEVMLFDRALTSNEVAAIVQSSASGVDPRLPADLQITAVTVPAAASAGTFLPVVWTVTNAGPYACTNARRDALWLSDDGVIGNDTFLGSFAVPGGLAAGAMQTNMHFLIAPPGVSGARWFVVQADYAQEVFEGLNESNNTAISTQSVSLSSADLVIDRVTVDPLTATAGGPLHVEWVVRNQGVTAAPAAWSDALRLVRGAAVQSLANTSAPAVLAAGASYTNQFTVTLPLSTNFPPGAVTLVVEADANHLQPESSDANNTGSASFTLAYPPLPDLVAASVNSRTNALPGDTLEVVWSVTNASALPVPGGWTAEIRSRRGDEADGSNDVRLLTSAATNALAPGGSLTVTQLVTLPADFPAGPWRFVAVVDADNAVVEENEANNVAVAETITAVSAALTLTASATEVREDAGAFTVLVTRNGDLAQPLTVTISNLHARLFTTNAVVIPAGSASVSVPLTVVRAANDFTDTPEELTAHTADTNYVPGRVLPVLVRNIDQPALTLALATNVVLEGHTVAVMLGRTGPTNLPVTITLGSPTPSQLLLPTPLTLAAGQSSATVAIMALDDTLLEAGLTTVQVNASAPGHATASAEFAIVDDDLPELSLEVLPATFSEGAGGQAAYLTVRRAVASPRALGVALFSGNTGAVLVPPSVIIPAFEAGASVPIAAVNNAQVDGPKTATLSAQARISGTTTPIGSPVQTNVTVTDDDGPALTVTVNPSAVREGQSATGTVRRNNGTNGALNVTLAVDRATEATVPPTVTIPDGAAEAGFTVNALTDAATDGSQNVTLTATAAGFAPGTLAFIVTDANLPDLVLTAVSGPATAYVSERATLTFRLANEGVTPCNGAFRQRVLLSRDNLVGDDILVTELLFTPETNTFIPGLGFSQSVQSFAFTEAGDFWVVVQADVANTIAELNEANNTRISAQPIRVEPNFTATVLADLPGKRAPAGTPVPLRGSVTVPQGRPVAGLRVDLHLTLREFRRVISAITDEAGAFATSFIPLPGEAGHYTVGAARGGETTATVQDEFTLLGAKFEPPTLTLRVDEGSSLSGRTVLRNLSDMPLSNLVASVLGSDPGLTFNSFLAGTTLAGNGTVDVNYVLTAALLSPLPGGEGQGEGGQSPRTINLTLRVTSSDATTNSLPVHITIEPLRPRLVAEPAELTAGMVRGGQRVVQFTLINQGRAPTGPLSVALPQAPWLMLSSTNPLPSLEPGASNTVTLLLTPAADLPLGPYTGQLGVNGASVGLVVPFTFRNLSDAKGDLRITAVDEFTYYAEGAPRVTNAAVLVRDAFSGTNEWRGVTDAQGELLLTNVMEGYYEVEVSAPDHGRHQSTILVEPGRTNELTAFLPRELVRYTWTVEPTEVEDRYVVVIEATFEANVPAPVVVLAPSRIILDGTISEGSIIEISLRNHGLIAANNLALQPSRLGPVVLNPLVTSLPILGAGESITVPYIVTLIADGSFDNLPSTSSENAPFQPASASVFVAGAVAAGVCILSTASAEDGTCCALQGTSPVWLGQWEICLRVLFAGPYAAWFGGQARDLWLSYLTEEDTAPPCPLIPAPLGSWPSGQPEFLDGSDIVEGLTLRAEGFKQNTITDAFVRRLESDIKKAALKKLAKGELGCGRLYDLKELVDRELGPEHVHETARQLLDWDTGEDAWLTIPGNIAGGVGYFAYNGRLYPEDRDATGSVSVEPVLDACGFVVAYELTPNVQIHISDALDFCHGILGWSIERVVTRALKNLEANGWATSVPYKVRFSALTQKLRIPGPPRPIQCEPSCCSTSLRVDYSYLCGGLQIHRSATAELFPALRNQCGGPPGGGGFGSGDGGGPTAAGGYYVEPRYSVSTAVSCNAPGGAGVAPAARRSPEQPARNLDSEGVCARVRIRLEQQAILTRSAFRANLELENRDSGPLTNIRVDLRFRAAGSIVATEFFGVRAPELTGLNAVDGSGELAAQRTGSASWVLIPTLDSAPAGPTQYLVGGTLRFTQNGTVVTIPLADVPITVHPGPELVVDYFHQRDVFSDDPFTDDVLEPALPYALGVMVRNVGRGAARNFRITSAQPQIVDNEKGLLIDFNLIGTEVAGQNLTPSLTANFGDIPAGTNTIARWLFTSTLQGLFIDYSATFEHLDAIAGRRLSIITNVAIHEMNRIVAAPGAFADGRPDFLLNEVADLDDLPDTIWLSDGTTRPVAVVQTGSAGILPANGGEVTLTAALPAGFAYLRVPDPAGASGPLALRLVAVRRPNGSLLPPENFWRTDRTFIGLGRRPIRENILHLFDLDSPGSYTLVYEPLPPADTAPPSSEVLPLAASSFDSFAVGWQGFDQPPGTVTGFDIFVSVDGGNFLPWLVGTPLNGAVYPGQSGHTYAFYSVAIDAAGNREPAPGLPDALTMTTQTNSAPHFAAVADVTLDEGQEFNLTLGASDAEAPPQTLRFGLLSGPFGLTLDETTGALRWPTGEGTGPSTNLVSVSVRDNGQPPLSDTTNFHVIVREVNTAPIIATITNRTVSETVLLTVVNTATDQDLPAQGLQWSFTGPTNAAINSTNGVFTWRPTAQQGPSTNRIHIIAKDYGTPQLSATQAFTVFVRDSAADFNLSLGATNVLGGESNSVPVLLSADVALAQLDFTLDVPPGPVTNLAVVDFGPGVNGVSFVPAGPGRNQVQFQLDGAGTLVTTRTLARLAFATLSNTPSAIVPLQVSNLVGLTTAGTSLLNAAATNGEVVVVNREPVLTARRGAGNARLLKLYGIPGRRYGLEWKASVGTAGAWQRVTNILQVSRIEPLSFTGSMSNDFYRAVDLSLPAGGLVLRPTLVAASNLMVLEMTVVPGCAYVIEVSADLANWTPQAAVVAETGQLRLTVELDPQEPRRFFRARAIPCGE